MYPSKNMYDYMTEMNRLFPRPTENDVRIRPELPPTAYNSLLMHSPAQFSSTMMANHSSSSADSISPEFFPHMSPPPPRNRMMNSRSIPVKHTMSETPFSAKRQRPIVGRRILGCNDQAAPTFDPQLSPIKSFDTEMASWQEFPNTHTPPNPKIFIEHKNYTQNVFYELFPTENRGYEFRTPDKTSTRNPSLACSSNISPNSTVSVSPSNTTQSFPTPPPPYRRNITRNFGPSCSRMNQDITPGKICTFCRKNGETPLVYMTHTVKEMVGNRNVVTCPILRSHVCSTCGASGDDAHTITYCPVLRSSNNGRPLQSTTITLKNTRVKSNGRKRY